MVTSDSPIRSPIRSPVRSVVRSPVRKKSSASDTRFISTWDTTNVGVSANDEIALPVEATSTFPFDVKENDIVIKTVTGVGDNVVTFASSGIKTITIDAPINGFRFNNGGDKLKLLDVSNWGQLNLGTSSGWLYGCSNFDITATDSPDMSGNLNMSNAFRDCSSLTSGNFNTWQTGSVTNMLAMMLGCSSYNQPLTLDTSSVTNMLSMLKEMDSFNQPINLNMLSVTNMQGFLQGSTAYNQTTSFNTPLCTTYSTAFSGCTGLNSPITLISPLVTNMSSLLLGSTLYNQPLTLDTSSVTNMASMFNGATNFDQDISAFDFSNVSNLFNFMLNTAFSIANYDPLLISLDSQTLKNSVNAHFGTAQYSAGAPATARANIISTYAWTITDGGQAP